MICSGKVLKQRGQLYERPQCLRLAQTSFLMSHPIGAMAFMCVVLLFAIPCFSERVHFQGKQLYHFICYLPSHKEQTFKENNLLLEEEIVSFKSRFHFPRASSSQETKRKAHKLFPFVKWRKKMLYPFALKGKKCFYFPSLLLLNSFCFHSSERIH